MCPPLVEIGLADPPKWTAAPSALPPTLLHAWYYLVSITLRIRSYIIASNSIFLGLVKMQFNSIPIPMNGNIWGKNYAQCIYADTS